ncbi:hypothetical protein PR003_g6551 [Phytophthora rubi]|uniref:Tc1-like transposase DDE domain-containing protein n=1 Tax=Phytophthora rubi TaxID=129364 RepID=A0A6A3MX20_9STRA|nr:hypothetical protein PR001_g8264 [Phytophthora rubi]KAE9348178.1 hypothetical protein PR003_g6551 [Phytophthora rubi]
MPSQVSLKKHSPAERRRILDAYNTGGDWRAVVQHNDFPRTRAHYLVNAGRVENLPCGGSCSAKVASEIKEALEGYLNECCSYTLKTMNALVMDEFQVNLSVSTISRHLLDMIYTVKQGDLVVYFDETNYNLYTKRSRGRAKKGTRAVEKLPSPKGANLQIHCAVSSAVGVVLYHTQLGSIKMTTNAAFVEELYDKIKLSDVYQSDYLGKKIVVVFDNAPAHNQTEPLVTSRNDLMLLRLGPYSPMCNHFEGCFSVLKAHVKEYLALTRDEMT